MHVKEAGQFRFPVFANYEVHVIFTKHIRATAKRVHKQNNWSGTPLSGRCEAATISQGEQAYLLFEENPTPETIAHECCHAVWALMAFVGAELEEEVLAYHVGYCVEQVNQFWRWAASN